MERPKRIATSLAALVHTGHLSEKVLAESGEAEIDSPGPQDHY